MRRDCKHYDSRTYPSGDVVQKCRLDLAPEAPWRCPDDCPAYDKRRMDAGWQYGSLSRAPQAAPVEAEGEDVASLLDEAEAILNSAAPEILEEFDGKKKKRRFGRKRKKKK